MERGKDWIDKIIIIRDEVSKLPKVTVEGLWTGKDRGMISRTLHREMRRAAHIIIQKHKDADLLAKQTEEVKVDTKPSKIDIMAKARAAKKLKKELEEGK